MLTDGDFGGYAGGLGSPSSMAKKLTAQVTQKRADNAAAALTRAAAKAAMPASSTGGGYGTKAALAFHTTTARVSADTAVKAADASRLASRSWGERMIDKATSNAVDKSAKKADRAEATAKAAKEVQANQERAAVAQGYSTTPAGGDNGVGLSTQAPLMVDENGAGAVPLTGWAALSPFAKVAILAGGGGAVFLAYRAFKKRGGGFGRRSKS